MSETKFPTVEEALYLHELLIARFGGSPGVVDLGLLESALARPRSGCYLTLSAQAAALLHSLAKNRAFVDGNKRMALALTATFLLMNGYNLRASANQSEKFILSVAKSDNSMTLEPIAKWIESHIVKAG
jgi:death-on-curing protein